MPRSKEDITRYALLVARTKKAHCSLGCFNHQVELKKLCNEAQRILHTLELDGVAAAPGLPVSVHTLISCMILTAKSEEGQRYVVHCVKEVSHYRNEGKDAMIFFLSELSRIWFEYFVDPVFKYKNSSKSDKLPDFFSCPPRAIRFLTSIIPLNRAIVGLNSASITRAIICCWCGLDTKRVTPAEIRDAVDNLPANVIAYNKAEKIQRIQREMYEIKTEVIDSLRAIIRGY